MDKALLCLMLILTSCAATIGKTTKERKADLYLQQGTQGLVQGNYTRALKDLLEAVKLDPKNSSIHNNLGMAYYLKKQTAKAKLHIERSIQLDATNTDAKSNLAGIYMDQGDYKTALKVYDQILKDLTYEKQYKTHYNMGLMYLKMKDNKNAISHFEKSIQENNNYCPSHFQIGLIAYHAGYYKKAVDGFKSAMKGVCVNNPAPHYYLGISYMEKGANDMAQEKFDYLIEKHSDTKFGTLAQLKISSLKSKQNSPIIEAANKREFSTRSKKVSPNF